MVLDRNENEPEEWDPEEEFYDPDSDGLTIPQVTTGDDASDDDPVEVDIPSVATSEVDAPDEVIESFWVLVLVINAAVLVVALGILLVAFEGDLRRGGILLTAGLVLFGLAGRRYRGFPDGEPTERDTEAEDTPTDTAEAARFGADETAETASGDEPQQRPRNRNDRS